MRPAHVRMLAGLAAVVAAAYVGLGEFWGSVVLAGVGLLIVVVEVLAAEPWKGGQDGQVG